MMMMMNGINDPTNECSNLDVNNHPTQQQTSLSSSSSSSSSQPSNIQGQVFQHNHHHQNPLYKLVPSTSNQLSCSSSLSKPIVTTVTMTTQNATAVVVGSGKPTAKVSFLEYVEVSGSSNINDGSHPLPLHRHPMVPSSMVCAGPGATSATVSYSPDFHYEPLRPPAGSSPPTMSSSNNSSPLSPLVSSTCMDHHGHSLHVHGQQPNTLNRSITAQAVSPCSFQSPSPSATNQQFQTLRPSQTVGLYPETSQPQQTSVIYKPVRSLIQYWPDHSTSTSSHSPSPINQFHHNGTLFDGGHELMPPSCSTSAMISSSSGGLCNIQTPGLVDALISKSSSSDSDTNDSATRLITDSLHEDLSSTAPITTIHSASTLPHHHHHVYLDAIQHHNATNLINNQSTIICHKPSIDTIIENDLETTSTPCTTSTLSPLDSVQAQNQNKDQDPSSNDLWIQIQGDLSKNLREKFLQNHSNNSVNSDSKPNSNNSNSSNSRKKKEFRFRRIGFGRCGFVCPLSRRAKTCLVSWLIALMLIILLSLFIIIFINGRSSYTSWFFWLFGNGRAGNTFTNRRYQFEQDPYWYHGTTVYEIFPPSFKDSDGDGFGDLNGIIERAEYLRRMGISAVRLNSIFSAFDYPRYYDNVLNFYEVDPHLGNFATFLKMIEVLHSKQIRVILDWNPTVTSDEHPWSLNQTEEYVNFYAPTMNMSSMMADEKTATTPNQNVDWTSINVETDEDELDDMVDVDGSEFSINPTRMTSSSDDRHQEQFVNMKTVIWNQPGSRWLNWSHEAVRTQLLKVADFWLRHVDGLYLKNLEQIYVGGEQMNNVDGVNSASAMNILNMNRERILLEFLQRLRRISEYHEQLYAEQHNVPIVLVPKKILICNSRLLSPLLTKRMEQGGKMMIIKKRRRQTKKSANYYQQIKSTLSSTLTTSMVNKILDSRLQHEYRPEFDELDLNDFDDLIVDDDLNSDPSAHSQKMLQPNSASTNHSSSSIWQQRNKSSSTLDPSLIMMKSIKYSIYHFIDMVHFELKLHPQHIDNIRDQVNYVFLNRPSDFPPIMWSVGSAKRSRLASKLGPKYSLASLFLLSMMPGTINIFYGDEIGMQNVYDVYSKKVFSGGQLCPMAWTGESPNGNFSLPNSSTWLPMHPEYGSINVEKRSDMVKIVSDLIAFRLDYLYSDLDPPKPKQPPTVSPNMATMTATNGKLANNNRDKARLKSSQNRRRQQQQQTQHLNYLFHYIDQTVVVLEQYFDRINPAKSHHEFQSTSSSLILNSVSSDGSSSASPSSSLLASFIRFRYVVFANLGNETVVKDFSDKFHFSLTQLATNVNRTSEFLIMKSLRLDPGEAMIATVE